MKRITWIHWTILVKYKCTWYILVLSWNLNVLFIYFHNSLILSRIWCPASEGHSTLLSTQIVSCKKPHYTSPVCHETLGSMFFCQCLRPLTIIFWCILHTKMAAFSWIFKAIWIFCSLGMKSPPTTIALQHQLFLLSSFFYTAFTDVILLPIFSVNSASWIIFGFLLAM